MWKRPLDTFGRLLPKAVFFFSFFFLVLVHCFRFFFLKLNSFILPSGTTKTTASDLGHGWFVQVRRYVFTANFSHDSNSVTLPHVNQNFIYLFILGISFFYFWHSRGYSVPFHTWCKKLNETFFSLHKSEKIKYIFLYIYTSGYIQPFQYTPPVLCCTKSALIPWFYKQWTPQF